MVRYELLLAARCFAQPRQFRLEVSAQLDGAELAKILAGSFGATRWFVAETALEDCGLFSARTYLLLTDIPRATATADGQLPSALQLFVASGPDAGASLQLTQGVHRLGRCAPLWLQDPLIARHHAQITVDQLALVLTCDDANSIRVEDNVRRRGAVTQLQLQRGSRFWLGNTELRVGDPVLLDTGHCLSAEQLRWQLPDKPELQRLIALCLAALVPMLSGVLLAVLTGSMLFLLLSGASALLGIVPAGQLIIERRRWKAKAVVHRAQVAQAREAYAPPLGISLLAGLTRTELGIPSSGLPPLVFGRGLWSPAAESVDTSKKRRRRPRRALDAPCPSPVFTATVPGAWQIVGDQDKTNSELLLALLARYLPAVLAGRLELVLDPQLECLPASLILLPGVRTGRPPAPSAPTLAAPATGEVRSIYVVASAAERCEESVVMGLSRAPVPQGTWWVNPAMPEARLEDPQLTLQSVQRLSAPRFNRLVDSCLALTETHRNLNSTTSPNAEIQRARRGLSAHIGDTTGHEPVILDFDADGPHMLICGTTGSGKSEALRRIVKELAAGYSPEELAFALVDFKGGAGLSVFATLPHVQLFASDLDAAAAQRTLSQLEVEVTRREQLLASYRCSDLLEYHQLSDPAPAMPRLLVVIDEFRVFSESIPEANPRIDRLAAVGRALGIHLLLSTQRPAGTLTGQTRANLNTVIALRVNDPGESIELVGIRDAASLVDPGQAIIHCATRKTRKFQFALAFDPPPYGELAERGPENLGARQICTFGTPPTAHEAMEALHYQVEILAQRWATPGLAGSPFAPALPSQPVPPESEWLSAQPASIWCGLIDQLKHGTLEPLFIGGEASHSLLVCGLPEAGPRQLLTGLCMLPRKILSFGPALVPDERSSAQLRQITGEDVYDFLDALDYLEERREDSGLLVLIHGVSQLQSLLHPQHFQRFDEVLGGLLRRSPASGLTIVLAVDRDQSLLKAGGLCTEQWYFPYQATESLKML
ncbi:FtsK/SpoIIIE domain-containing protein [Glutamicibacter arilaitensis]|uniref:FHA domain-containing protein n=1 Tax=Glutamicibacter arilaitensis TaxID=256701 RepID=UPI00384BEC67